MPKLKALPQVKIVDENKVEVPIEIIATHIARLADLGERLKNSGLKERAVVLLLKDLSGLSMVDVERVLRALPRLREFLK